LFTNDEIKIIEMSQTDIAISKNAKCGAFVGNGRNTIALEKIEKVEEFSREEKTLNHVDTILIAKLLHETFWHGLKMDLLKIPIEKWHHSMSPRCPY